MSDEPRVDPNKGSEGYSKEYISELRSEAAHWRTKFRETEKQLETYAQAEQEYILNDKVSQHLEKKGIKDVDPTWVDVQDGQDVSDAVDSFLEKHPRFKVDPGEEAVPQLPQGDRVPGTHPPVPSQKPMATEQRNTNIGNYTKDYATIKQDPIARTKLRELYRGLLSQQQNTGLTL